MKFKWVYILILGISFQLQAGRSRLSSLQSIHLNDPELIYYFPTKMIEIPDYLAFQTGPMTPKTRYFDRPSVALKKDFSSENSDFYSLGINLGRSSDLVDFSRAEVNSILGSQYEYTANPVDVNYAFKSLGKSYSLGFFYAEKNDRLNIVGNHAATMNLGFRIDDFSFSSIVGLYNYIADPITTSHLSINQSFVGRLLYELDDVYILLDISSSQVKKYVAEVENIHLEFLNYKMGLVKNEFNGDEKFFYRLDLMTEQVKNRTAESAERTIFLPLTFGIETVLNEQMSLRSSVQQIVGVYKKPQAEPGLNTTTASVGLSLNFNKIAIEGQLQGLVGSNASQKLSGNDFLSETSLTYWY